MLLTWSLLLICLFFSAIKSAPTSQSPHYLAWKIEPNVRGTWSLLSSCVITLVLCVYTALHLNIPGKDEERKWKTLRKVKWTVVALLCPEIVVYCAWQQWTSANQFTREILSNQTTNRTELGDSKHLDWSDWTLSHSFFVQMGGYNIGNYHGWGPNARTVSPKAFLKLRQLGVEIPVLSTQSIRNRSKADAITKTITIVQASFLLLQQVGRLSSHLPISMLEVNTVGHIFCALIMYLLWLQKPLGLEEPDVLHTDMIDALRHRFGTLCVPSWSDFDQFEQWVMSGDGLPHPGAPLWTQHQALKEIPNLRWRRSDRDDTGPLVENLESVQIIPLDPNEKIPESSEGLTLILHCVPPECTSLDVRAWVSRQEFWPRILSGIRYSSENNPNRGIFGWEPIEYDERTNQIILDMDDAESFDRIWQQRHFTSHFEVDDFPMRISNWPTAAGTSGGSVYKTLAAIAIVTGLYGGLHALLWNSHFPTGAERWLWRCSACVIAGSGLMFAFAVFVHGIVRQRVKAIKTDKHWLYGWNDAHLLGQLFWWIENPWFSLEQSGGHEVMQPLLFIILLFLQLFVLAVLGLVYVFARCYLVVEAFISLRSLPAETYITPTWVQWIPHL